MVEPDSLRYVLRGASGNKPHEPMRHTGGLLTRKEPATGIGSSRRASCFAWLSTEGRATEVRVILKAESAAQRLEHVYGVPVQADCEGTNRVMPR